MNELTLRALRDDELMHYGVIGMKWGVRRYQPYGQGYDPEHKGKFVGNKRQIKREFRKDNARLKEAVKDASIKGYAMSKSNWKANRFDKEHIEDPGSKVKARKAAIERRTAADLEEQYKQAEAKAIATVKEMREKYGNDAVRDIIYKEDKFGNKVVNEKVASGGEYAASLIASAASYTIAAMMGLPVAYVAVPASRSDLGNRAYSNARAQAKAAQKQIDAVKKASNTDSVDIGMKWGR